MAKATTGAVTSLANTSVAAGTTKSSPVGTGSIDIRNNYGTGVTIAIQNGASGPAAPLVAQPQVSYDGTAWRDYGPPVVGTTDNYSASTLAGYVTGSIDIPKQYQYARVIAYGNTSSAVSVSVEVEACTGL